MMTEEETPARPPTSLTPRQSGRACRSSQLSKTYPADGDRGRLSRPGSLGRGRDRQGRPRRRPQDRPDVARHADGVEDDRAGLRPHPRRRALQRRRPDPGRPLHQAAARGGARLRHGRGPRRAPARASTTCMRATEFVVPALEIIDYRTEVPRAIVDTIADNAAFGAIVARRPHHPADGRRHPLGRSDAVEERHHRGIRCVGRRHGPSGGGHRLARQQARMRSAPA